MTGTTKLIIDQCPYGLTTKGAGGKEMPARKRTDDDELPGYGRNIKYEMPR